MELTFRNLIASDSTKVNKLLKSTGNTERSNLSTLLKSVDDIDSIAIIMENTVTHDILGVWLSTRFKEHISITFFYVIPDVRKKLAVFDFFRFCINEANPNYSIPMFIHAQDISTFNRYVVPVDTNKDLYKFIGFNQRRVNG